VGFDGLAATMSKLLGNAGQGLPPLVGVLWGIYLYSSALENWWLPVPVIVGAFLVMRIGRCLLHYNPLLGCALIELWVAASVSIVALGTMLVLWLSVHAGDFLQGTAAEKKAVSAALVGAVTAYLAVLWTKDIQASEGSLWSGTQLKEGLSAAFEKEDRQPEADSREWDAVWENRVRCGGPVGWGLKSRWWRCGILGRYLKKRRRTGS